MRNNFGGNLDQLVRVIMTGEKTWTANKPLQNIKHSIFDLIIKRKQDLLTDNFRFCLAIRMLKTNLIF